jgi:NAD-dependent dihydropyrimidine dehydrogenase PreA subunit
MPLAVNRLSSGTPTVPVAPVRSSTGERLSSGRRAAVCMPGGRAASRRLRVRLPKMSDQPPETTKTQEEIRPMAYVIAEPCIGTKDNSCVEVCPVDCIHPTPDEPDYDQVEMLYIDPEECIDCDACVEACPVDACFAEDQLPEEWQKYSQINAEYYAKQT